MTRYDRLEAVTNSGIPVPEENLQSFKNAVAELCKKHDVTLLHEDWEGGFQVVSGYDKDLIRWFLNAFDPNKRKRFAKD